MASRDRILHGAAEDSSAAGGESRT